MMIEQRERGREERGGRYWREAVEEAWRVKIRV